MSAERGFHYENGHSVEAGDQILWHSEPGAVEYVVVPPGSGDPALDWHLTDCPGGGIMIRVPSAGRVFELSTDDLQLLRRAPRE